MWRTVTYSVLALVGCIAQPGLVVAAVAQQQAETAVGPANAAGTTKSGVADGEWSPALTGARRPLYRLHKSDVVEIDFTFSPQFNQTLIVQPDGFIPLKGVEPLYVETATLPQMQQAIRRAYTVYVPNGARIRGRSTPSQILDWGLAPDNYALFLGRFSPEKNCHLLIEAYETLATSSKLVLAGGSSHTGAYAEELRRHGNDRIILKDWVSGPALDDLLTNAALFVLPSDLEGLSLALLDAMGAGVCVLTSDIPENREVVEDAGFTFRAGDVDDLSRMLGLLLSDREVRAASGRSGKKRIQDQYLWPQIALAIGQVYDELAGRKVAVSSGLSARVRAGQTAERPENVA